ncbi:DUF427 domain-containing protein [Paracoccus yeei]|uniref:DUF427 domain-containing protein n=1 Tax=Paracoccus yeei TaxID=147645 RepID=A0A5P2QTB8_9RHOB|nr:DUF427 domain-containing protein [Paracoccus yeei]QEU09308.1 DUF427 domain-containing protein [Paracoccus yeei]
MTAKPPIRPTSTRRHPKRRRHNRGGKPLRKRPEPVQSNRTTSKGTAQYFHLRVGDRRNANAAWTYADPSPAAHSIKDHIAFWKGVNVA